MHPRLRMALDHVDHSRLELLAALDTVPVEHQAVRPAPDSWSAAEVLEHLARVERGLVKLAEMKLAEFRAMSPVPAEATELPAFDLAKFTLVEARTTRLDAPERVCPTGTMSAPEGRTAILEVRRAFLEQLSSGDGLPLSQVVHPHPFLGPLDLYEWVYLIGSHEVRHARQLREIAAHFATAVS